jgi:general secretion pathway protein K
MTARARDGRAGFALLIVLWALGLLSLITTELTASARVQARVAAAARDSAAAQAAADGAALEAVFRLLDQQWAADGTTHATRIGRFPAAVRITSEDGKVNPNFVTVALLRALLRNAGAAPGTAEAVARAIQDWRASGSALRGSGKAEAYAAAGRDYGPSGEPFRSLDELGAVLGMTPDLLARVKPLLSIYKEGTVDRALAGVVGAQAVTDAQLGQQGPTLSIRTSNVVAMVTAEVARPGVRATRQTVVRVKTQIDAEDKPFEVLTWESEAE